MTQNCEKLPDPNGSNLGIRPLGMLWTIGSGIFIGGRSGISKDCIRCIWPLNFGPKKYN